MSEKTPHILQEDWDKLLAENAKLKRLETASIEFYCGMMTQEAWREFARTSTEGQRLIALAEETRT